MIFGLGGNDRIFAGTGTNHLFGGDVGTDKFVVNSPGDRVVAKWSPEQSLAVMPMAQR